MLAIRAKLGLLPLDILGKRFYHPPRMSTNDKERVEFLQGTLDMLVLRTLLLAPAHGHATQCHLIWPRYWNAAALVGRTPWSAADAPVGLLRPAPHNRLPRSEEDTSEIPSLRHLVC